MKLEERAKARGLRFQGLSIKQIATAINVSKGSISAWVKDINLNEEALLNIDKRLQLGRERARQSRLANISRSRKELFERCKTQVLPLSHRDLWIAGLMLYAGEGRKVWNVSSQPIELTSSDPSILRIFISFLVKVCNVPNTKIGVRLFLYPDIDLKEAKNFWSRELKIPLN